PRSTMRGIASLERLRPRGAYPARFPAESAAGSARRREEAMPKHRRRESTQRSLWLIRQAPREKNTKHLDYSYSLIEQADVALMLWRQLGITSAHVFAHDYGTSVATELLARWNRGLCAIELRSMTLCNGSVHIKLASLRVVQKLLLS